MTIGTIKNNILGNGYILEALKERDIKKARRLIKLNIKNGREHIVGSLRQDRRLEL